MSMYYLAIFHFSGGGEIIYTYLIIEEDMISFDCTTCIVNRNIHFNSIQLLGNKRNNKRPYILYIYIKNKNNTFHTLHLYL